jgi:predicted CopG family antitoxin
MATKTLSISEKAYNSLVSLKQGNESFSELILRITQPQMKGIKPLLNWLAELPDEKLKLLNDLSNSVEKVTASRDQTKWRSVEL